MESSTYYVAWHQALCQTKARTDQMRSDETGDACRRANNGELEGPDCVRTPGMYTGKKAPN